MSLCHISSKMGAIVSVALLVACGESGGASPPRDSTATGGATSATGGQSSGTGGAGGTGGSATVVVPENATEVEACRHYVTAFCARLAECDPDLEAPCLDLVDLCPSRLFADGSSWTIRSAYECAAAWKDFSCEEAVNEGRPECANVPGSRAEGELCFTHAQCAGGLCSSSPLRNQFCGTCKAPATSHGACSYDTPCGWGETCESTSDATTGTCVDLGAVPTTTPVPVGGACGRRGPRCAPRLVCEIELIDGPDHLEPDTGVCQQPAALGSPCTPTFGHSGRCEDGATCNARPTGNCVAEPSAGESCGYTTCDDQSWCNINGLSTMPTHMCYARGAAGDACERDYVFGRESSRCQVGLECLCTADGCSEAFCAAPRERGESCNGSTEICRQGFECTDGVCAPSAERDLAAQGSCP